MSDTAKPITEKLKLELSAALGDDAPLPTTRRSWPAPPSDIIYHGLAGDIVRFIEPHSEADPVAVLVSVLVGFGNIIGRKRYFIVGGKRHHANLFAVTVGRTSSGRKGVAWDDTSYILSQAAETWFKTRVVTGLSSGEGLIDNVRDPMKRHEKLKDKGSVKFVEVEEPGIDDKRLTVIETEFVNALRVMGREGNILSGTIRNAWDGGKLSTLTKNNPQHATDAHISIIGHITPEELRATFNSIEGDNGFGNRFLWFVVRRSKELPLGGALVENDASELVDRLRAAIASAENECAMPFTKEAEALWCDIYHSLCVERPGMAGKMVARFAPIMRRIAMIYCLLDGEHWVDAVHLAAARELVAYSERCVNYLFGTSTGNRYADDIEAELRALPNGKTRTELRDHFNRHGASRIQDALVLLKDMERIIETAEKTPGRTAYRYRHVSHVKDPSVASDASVATPPSSDAEAAA